MTLFNIVLIVHFVAFLFFLGQLVVLFPMPEKQLHKHTIFLGVAILVTGIFLVVLKYPQVNLYKVIPKSALFVVISTFCGIYSGKALPKNIYRTLMALTVLASLIAVFRV
ncbi:hypothetical protein [Chryseolinea soli]|uniref:Uncharacterized protein n=1 Tax=Chryseolinea soli TaxID=2321403 RepID=A0A385SKL6_9BACT|nr:hypothetical protein [Chryseolinea soli]AYB31504.1 hypothetical protein D4L85_13370 [Chryseolinea soli]